MSQIPTETDVLKMLDTLSNWGRWGADDQLGTLNFITPEVRKRAAALVREGVPVSCSRPISTEITADTSFQSLRFMVDSGEGRDTAPLERNLQRRGAAEFIGMVFHGYTITHVDTPAHYFWNGRLYNGLLQPRHVARGRPGRGGRPAAGRRRQPWRPAGRGGGEGPVARRR
jgi:hypothetical protein